MFISFVLFLIFIWLIIRVIESGENFRATAAENDFIRGIKQLDTALVILSKAEIVRSTSALVVKEIAQSLRLPIRRSHRFLTEALKFWKGEKSRQHEEIEKLTASICNVKTTVSEKEMELQQLIQQIESLDEQILANKCKVEQAKSSLNKAQDTLNDAERKLREKKEEQDLVWRVGLTITPIPIVGWIVGPTMIVISLTALEDNVKYAQKCVSSAEGNVNDCESRLQVKRCEKGNLQTQLTTENSAKMITEQRLRDQKSQKQHLEDARRRSVDVSDKLMKTCHVMTNIWGKSHVLNSEARHAYSLEPLLPPLIEMLEMFTPEEQLKIKQNTFLLSKNIDLPALSWKLKAMCEANNTDSSMMAILDEYT